MQAVSVNTLVKKILDVKEIIVEDVELYEDEEGVKHLKVMARVYKRADDRCPKCGRKCSRYDSPKRNGRPVRKRWRALDFAGIIVEIEAQTHRIECPEHGVLVAAVPWASHDCGFTKSFDNTVAWMAKHLSLEAVSEYMRIGWHTVGRCISRVWSSTS